MKPRIKFGLIVGVIGLVLNVCVSTAVGICGPGAALIAGAVSGFLTARQEKAATKGEAAKSAMISGLVAGALVFVGQLIGAVGALAFMQNSGTKPLFGQLPDGSGGLPQQIIFYMGGLGAGACFGIIGIALAAAAAAGVAYLTTQENPVGYVNQGGM